tara:strand:- start:243 stop:464 length:222 start_codon:yes stop_codon:yes gene_type:complete
MCASPLLQRPLGGVAGAVFPNATKKVNETFKNPVGGALALAAPKTAENVNNNLKKISDVRNTFTGGGGVAHLS